MSRMMENLIGIAALGLGAYIFVVYVLPQMGNIFPPAAASDTVVATDDTGLLGGNLETLLLLQSLGIDPADMKDLSKKDKKDLIKKLEKLGIDKDMAELWIDEIGGGDIGDFGDLGGGDFGDIGDLGGFDSGSEDIEDIIGDINDILKGDSKSKSKSKSKNDPNFTKRHLGSKAKGIKKQTVKKAPKDYVKKSLSKTIKQPKRKTVNQKSFAQKYLGSKYTNIITPRYDYEDEYPVNTYAESRFARNANIYDLWYGGNFH